MLFRQLFDPALAQYAYLIGCQKTGEALIVDPERDVDRYIAAAAAEGLRITAVTETHIHADFLSGTRELGQQTGATVYLSDEGDADWQYRWPDDGLRVQRLRDGDTFRVGNITVTARHTPGHTPEHLAFLIQDDGGGADTPLGLVSGDFVFVGDLGRPDLLETAAGHTGTADASARRLYTSAQAFLALPDHLQVWPGHGAGSACGKALGAVPQSTVGYERRFNAALRAAETGEAEFVSAILDGQPAPPTYFARMKRENRDGPALLGALPRPRRLTADALAALSDRTDVAVLDTRTDRMAFADAHLPASLHTPLGKTFPTLAGSYVTPELPVTLIVEDDRVEDAVRMLVRVGLDRVEAYATPATLAEALVLTVPARLQTATFEQAFASPAVLDVRGTGEHAAGALPDAVNVPHTRLAARLGDVPRPGPVYVHCQSGIRAAAAAAYLQRQGVDVRYVAQPFSEAAPLLEPTVAPA